VRRRGYSNAPKLDFAEVDRQAAGRIAAVAEFLFPGGKLRRGEYVATNHVRGDRNAGSFSVNVATGEWNDFADATARGGDVVSLWAYARGCGSQAEAARALLEWLGGAVPAVPVVRPPTPVARQLDAGTLWGAARPVWPIADADVARWLDARGLCAASVDGLGLARWVTRWPWGSGPESAARKLVVRVYDANGEFVALRGRLVADVPGASKDTPKEKGPPGVPAGGRLLACPRGVAMLRGDAEAGRHVVICEGTPDWLSVATLWDLAEVSIYRLNSAPAVLGIWGGSLTPELLARIPDGAVVTLCPHKDRSGVGIRYMRDAASALLPRGCRLFGAPYDGELDFNDTLQTGGNARLWQRLDAAEAV
jgi:hypothetical protein